MAIGPPTETIGPQVQWSRSGGGLGGTPRSWLRRRFFLKTAKLGPFWVVVSLFSPSFFPSFFLPFLPFPFLSPQVYIQLMLSKTLFYLHFSAIKNHKILFTLQQSGRHLLQHPWRPHSNALHSADEAPLQTAQLLCCPSA